MIQSERATEIARRVTSEADRAVKPGGTLEGRVRLMVRRWQRDGYRGTAEQWEALARMVGRL